MIAPEHVAALIVFVAVVTLYAANPLAKWHRRSQANLDRLIAEALDQPRTQPRTRAVHSGRKSGRTGVAR